MKEEMMYREEEHIIDEMVSHFKNMEISECVEDRIQETYRKILEDTAEKD